MRGVSIEERALAQYIIDSKDTVRGETKRFGVLKPTVHMDEETPHMHLLFIPVVHTQDKKGNNIDKIDCSDFWKRIAGTINFPEKLELMGENPKKFKGIEQLRVMVMELRQSTMENRKKQYQLQKLMMLHEV